MQARHLIATRRAVRETVYRAEKAAQRIRFLDRPASPPALLGISFPKSGTNLLAQILLGFGRVAPYARRLHPTYEEHELVTGRLRPPADALRWLSSLGPRDVTAAHLYAREDVVAVVSSGKFLSYFILRDPRDVAVSHAFFVTNLEPRHSLARYYASLPDFSARLKVSIEGLPELGFPDIATRFAPYERWLDCPALLTTRYEDLVNSTEPAISRIADHFLMRVPVAAPRGRVVYELERSMNPKRSWTYRAGTTGQWRDYFTPEHEVAFKRVAPNLVARLGYESDDSW